MPVEVLDNLRSLGNQA